MPKVTMGAQGLVTVTWERRGSEKSRHPCLAGQALPSLGLELLIVASLSLPNLGQGDRPQDHTARFKHRGWCVVSAQYTDCHWFLGRQNLPAGETVCHQCLAC